MKVAVAGVKDVGHTQAVTGADLRDADQDLRHAAERYGAIHTKVVGDPANCPESRLAAFPDGRALLGALTNAHDTRRKGLHDLDDTPEEH